ncbi:hypothetical protein GCM10009754_73930 [Amycolatopsis minnesotensis]|uniref:Immunity protein Imm1 n=2 Tax=Amycolatopsis minnesotensis TaxID=337894 RepID=A0ABP5DVC0_9PSEU
MSITAEWEEFDNDLKVTCHEMEIKDENDIPQLVAATTQETDGEEVLLVAGPEDSQRRFTFQYNKDRTLVYVHYIQIGLGTYFVAEGDPESPELFTSSGGSFYPGSGLTPQKFETVLREFVRTKEKPTTISWKAL